MRYYPVFLNLRGRGVVVVGGGKVAERKVLSLLRAGARVRVISPELTPRLRRLAAANNIGVWRRRYKKADLRVGTRGLAPLLVFAATNDPSVQQAVRKDGQAAGALVNVADDPSGSGFLVPASFARGDLQVAISTSGASPALARILRLELQQTLGQGFRKHLRTLRAAREGMKKSIAAPQERARAARSMARKVKRQRSKGKSSPARVGGTE